MSRIRLTQRRVDALRPRRKLQDVRDADLKGYGVRIMPSGAKRYFIHSQHRGRRVWKTVGDAAAITETEARARARSLLATLRDGRDADATDPGDIPFETVAEEVFERYGRRWKPRTFRVNRIYLRRQILPWFEGRTIGEITRQDVQAWFRSLHATPAAANRAAPILSVIMQQAEAWSYRPEDSNPCKGIRRYRQARSERFLSPEESDIIRLLLLTGCRKGEIQQLKWSEVDGDMLRLETSKTGPRKVWLSEAAQAILARQPRTGSAFVFPSPKNPARPRSAETMRLWDRARTEAGIEDTRLHDLRHTVASQAVARGIALSTVARMLGHSDPKMTLRYAHVRDPDVEAAAERVGKAIEAALAGRHSPGR